MYKAKKSVILEDRFGLDHQFLKGHLYAIDTNSETRDIIFKGAGWIRVEKSIAYFLTKEQVEKYFEWVHIEPLRGGSGNPKLIAFKGKGESD